MALFAVYRGEWFLSTDGEFKKDPWFIFCGSTLVEKGFGKPPKEFFSKKLIEGVLLPGMVNAHTHLELSFLKNRIPPFIGIKHFALRVIEERQKTSPSEIRRSSIEALSYAYSRGTFFFNDISNDPYFSHFLLSNPYFQGNRFFELLVFQEEIALKRILYAKKKLEKDPTLLPTFHSIYGSSPYILEYVKEWHRNSTVSFHILESPDERDFPYAKGELYELIKELGQYQVYRELYHTSLLEYLYQKGMFSFKKVFLVHLTYATYEELEFLHKVAPHAAWVICERSTEFLGYERNNWRHIFRTPLRFLLGTDSLATNRDVSMLDEIYHLAKKDVLPLSMLFLAATYNAYSYLEIPWFEIPIFLFPGAKPDIESLYYTKRAYPLRAIL